MCSMVSPSQATHDHNFHCTGQLRHKLWSTAFAMADLPFLLCADLKARVAPDEDLLPEAFRQFEGASDRSADR